MNLLKKILLAALVTIAPSLAHAFTPIRYVQISTNTLTQQTGAFNVAAGTMTTLSVSTVTASSATVNGPLNVTGTATLTTLAGTITDNSTTTHTGGQTFNGSATFTTVAGTITNNSTTTYTGAQTFSSATVTGQLQAGTFKTTDGATITSLYTGRILQIISASVAASSATTVSASFVNTNLSLNITPTVIGSTIVLVAQGMVFNGTASQSAELTILRGATNLGPTNGLVTDSNSAATGPAQWAFSTMVLDPTTSLSALTYTVGFRSDGAGTVTMTPSGSNSRSSLYALEIGK